MSLYYKTDTAVVCVWVNKQVNPQCVCVCKWVHCGKRSDSFRTVLVVLLDYRLYIFITIVIILKILIQSCLQVYEWSGYLQFNYIIHVLGFTSFYLVQSVAGFLFVFEFLIFLSSKSSCWELWVHITRLTQSCFCFFCSPAANLIVYKNWFVLVHRLLVSVFVVCFCQKLQRQHIHIQSISLPYKPMWL